MRLLLVTLWDLLDAICCATWSVEVRSWGSGFCFSERLFSDRTEKADLARDMLLILTLRRRGISRVPLMLTLHRRGIARVWARGQIWKALWLCLIDSSGTLEFWFKARQIHRRREVRLRDVLEASGKVERGEWSRPDLESYAINMHRQIVEPVVLWLLSSSLLFASFELISRLPFTCFNCKKIASSTFFLPLFMRRKNISWSKWVWSSRMLKNLPVVAIKLLMNELLTWINEPWMICFLMKLRICYH